MGDATARAGQRLVADFGRHEAYLREAAQVVVFGVAGGQARVGEEGGGVVVDADLPGLGVRHDCTELAGLWKQGLKGQ